MTLPQLASYVLIFFFGLFAIALSIREEQTRRLLKTQDKIQKQKIFQISILKEIQDRIGYSLDIEEVIDVITGSLKHIFPYSSASSMVLKQEKIIFKTYIEEQISHKFKEEVKQSMIASMRALFPILPGKLEETVSGVPFDDSNNLSVSSFFHIPLVVNNQIVGLINISSTKLDLYKEDEMTILYQMTAEASNALTRLHEVLETEKGKLTSMIGSLSDGVFMLDNEKNVLIINDSAKRFLKLSSNPTFFDILNAFPKEYDLVTRLEKVSLTKLPSQEIEARIDPNMFETFITPVISSPNSQVIGIAFLLHDITLQKNLSEMKEDFTNMMVHELRAPLTNIKDASSLMLDNDSKLSEDQKVQFTEMVHSQAKILLTQVSDLLDASKIEAGKFTVNKSQNDLGKIIQDVIKTFLPQAEKKQINLTAKISPLPPVELDPVRITQVLNNLVSNSLKFTLSGGQIKITTLQKGNFIEVSVADTGSGIPADKQKDLFSKFYQVTKTSNNVQGTGLGLYLVKGVVTAHNGFVSLASEEGKGTTITFMLPMGTQNQTANYRTVN